MGGTSESGATAQIQGPAGATPGWHAPDERRTLQLVLATIWLFDGVLQLQPVMFTRQFGTGMLAPMARGNPTAVAHSVRWASGVIAGHSVGTDAAFAAIQILLALGIAWRPTVKMALAASIGWSCLVWWFGEGLGGVLTTASSTIGGAPGAVVLYGVLAVLLWPVDRAGPDPSCTAARAVGEGAARVIWTVLWGALALFAVLGANRSADGLGRLVRGLGPGEPSWLATVDRHAADALAHHGLAVSIALAVVLGVIALGASLPWRLARIVTVLAVAVVAVVWVLGQNFGTLFSGSATDPNTGPLLALAAAAYWRRKPATGPLGAPDRDLVMEAV